MDLAGVHHVSLNVSNLDACTRFYVDVLGLEILPRPDLGFPGLWVRAGEQEIHLLQRDDWEAPAGQHFAFRVSDLEAAIQELAERGVEVKGPFEIPETGRQVFFYDPAGNMIELNQPL